MKILKNVSDSILLLSDQGNFLKDTNGNLFYKVHIPKEMSKVKNMSFLNGKK